MRCAMGVGYVSGSSVCDTLAFVAVRWGRHITAHSGNTGAIAARGLAADLRVGLVVARGAFDSGAAGERLELLIAFSRETLPG